MANGDEKDDLRIVRQDRILASIDSASGYNGLIQAIRARIVEIDASMETVDDRAGLPLRYTSKLLTHMKSLGPISFGPLLGALGLKLLVVEDGSYQPLPRRKPGGVPLNAPHDALHRKRCAARIGRTKWLLISSSEQRSNIARIAAIERWRKAKSRSSPA